MSNEPWYRKGLRFECTGCGGCCTGAPGYVWVNTSEIAALAARLDLEVEKFETKYVRRVGVRKSLVEFDNGDCVFFNATTHRCEVYEDRPRQCQTWPFWDSNVRTPEAWERTCQACPGSGTGPLISLEQINEQLRAIKL